MRRQTVTDLLGPSKVTRRWSDDTTMSICGFLHYLALANAPLRFADRDMMMREAELVLVGHKVTQVATDASKTIVICSTLNTDEVQHWQR